MFVLPTSQNQRRALYRNLMYALLLALLACAVVARTFGVAVHWPTLAIVSGVGVVSMLQFNALDEVAKQAHYVAWYWGSLIALAALALMHLLFVFTGQPFAYVEAAIVNWLGDSDAMTSFLAGTLVTPLLMMLCFSAWWTVYWLRRG